VRSDAKASSAGSTSGQGRGLGSFVRGAFAIRGASVGVDGSGARSHRLPSFLAFALLLSATMGLMASSALGAETHPYTGTSFGPDGAGGSASFQNLQSLAVDQASGNLFAYDAGAEKIYKFSASGVPVSFSGLSGNAIEGVGGGGGNGEFEIAVAPAGSPGGTAGDIYVANNSNSLLIYSAAGESLGEIAIGGETCGVAVNPAGHVFVGIYSSEVREFVPTANPPTAADESPTKSSGVVSGICNIAADGLGNVYAAGYSGGPVSKLEGLGDTTVEVVDASANTIAVDPATNDLYADRREAFAQYDSAANLIGNSGSGQLNGSLGIAVNGAGGTAYAGNGAKVDVFGPPVVVSSADTRPASIDSEFAATLHATVNTAGLPVSECVFEYGTDQGYGNTVPCEGAVPADEADHPVEAKLTDLTPSTTYHFRIVFANDDGTIQGVDKSFKTPGPPIAETTGSLTRTATSALLEGRVDPQGKAATYYFEYGSDGPCDVAQCQKTNPISAGDGDELVLVAQQVTGLLPGTTYHYRVVGSNGDEATISFGNDMTVTTRSSDASLSHGTLPGPPGSDRAWEQVNPPDTGGHSVTEVKAVSNDGERLVYNVKGGTPQSNIGSLYTPLLAERTDTGWKSQSITPSQDQPGTGKAWLDIEADPTLSTMVARTYGPGTGLWRLNAGAPPSRLFTYPTDADFQYIDFYAMSEDGSTAVSTSPDSLDPDHPVATAAKNLYDISSGAPRLVDLMPDGSVPSCGVTVEGASVGKTFALASPARPASHWVSPDGSRVFFPSQGDDCAGSSQFYVRDLQTETTERISPPSISGEECSAAFIKSTEDAVYFWTAGQLSAEDTAPSFCGAYENGDIYRYGLADHTISCLTCVLSGQSTDVYFNSDLLSGPGSFLAVADDGSRIYFSSPQQLVPGAATPGIYRIDTRTDNLRYIASGAAVGELPANLQAMTSDGSVVVFASDSGALNPIGGADNGGTMQYYLYDDRRGALTCASCPQDGSTPAASATVSQSPQGGLVTAELEAGPNLTPLDAAGDIFAFATPTSLVRQDLNEAKAGEPPITGTDAYEWRDGRPILVTDGTSEAPGSAQGSTGVAPTIAGVSPSGRDVYFQMAARLTPDATEAFPRLYDARLGGGFSFPKEIPPCPLEVCQGTPATPPEQPSPASSSFSGPGNVEQHPRKHAKKHGGKHKRGHKKKHKKSSRSRSPNNRRTFR
jgi:hypothetical protein